MKRYELEIVAESAIKKFKLAGRTYKFSDICRPDDELVFFVNSVPDTVSKWSVPYRNLLEYKEDWQNRKWKRFDDSMEEEPWKWLTPKAYKNLVEFGGYKLDDGEVNRLIKTAKKMLDQARYVSVKALVEGLVGNMWGGVELWHSREELELHKKEAYGWYDKVFDYLCLPCEKPAEWYSPFIGWTKGDGVSLINPENVDDYYDLG